MKDNTRARIKEYIETCLGEKRRNHIDGVVNVAVHLALQYGENPEKAELAALFHDMYRGTPGHKLDDLVRAYGLEPVYLGNSNLSHGKIAAAVMEKEYGITDSDLINAVSYHTTGRAGMSRLEKILYLADAIEPGRNYPGITELRQLAAIDLNKACILALTHSIDFVTSRGLYLDQATVEAKQQLSEEEEERKENGQS